MRKATSGCLGAVLTLDKGKILEPTLHQEGSLYTREDLPNLL